MGSASSTRKKTKKKGSKQSCDQASTSTNVRETVPVAHQRRGHFAGSGQDTGHIGHHAASPPGPAPRSQTANSQDNIEDSTKKAKDNTCQDVEMAVKGESSMLVDSSESETAQPGSRTHRDPLSLDLPVPRTPGAQVHDTETAVPEVSPNGRYVTSMNQGEGVEERNDQSRGVVELLSGTSVMSDVSLASVSSSPGSSRRGLGSHTSMPDPDPASPTIPVRVMADQVASPTLMATDVAPGSPSMMPALGSGAGAGEGDRDEDVDMGECTPVSPILETHVNQNDSNVCSHTPDMVGTDGNTPLVPGEGTGDDSVHSPVVSPAAGPSSQARGDELRCKWRAKWKEESKLSQQEANQRLMERHEFEKALASELGPSSEAVAQGSGDGDHATSRPNDHADLEQQEHHATCNNNSGGGDDDDDDGVVVDESAGDGEDPAELLARLQAIKKKKEQSQKRENNLKLELSRLKAIERIIHKEKEELSKAEREAQQWLQEQRQEQDNAILDEGNARTARGKSASLSRSPVRTASRTSLGRPQQRDPAAVLGGTGRASAGTGRAGGKALTGKKRKKKPMQGNQLPIAQRVYGT